LRFIVSNSRLSNRGITAETKSGQTNAQADGGGFAESGIATDDIVA
jgi:hypothetical protein